MNCLRQMVGRLLRQASQSPHGITAGTMTERPIQFPACSPACTTRPAISCPIINGSAWRVGMPSSANPMSVWQTPQPTTSMITSSGESSPRAVSAQSNWPLTTNLRPLLVAGVEQALCAGRGVVIGSLLTHTSNERSKTMCQGTLVGEIEDVIAITSCCDLMAESVLPKMRADIWLLRYLARLGQSFSSFSCSAFWYAALCSGVIW